MRIIHYPFIRTQAECDDLYHRACWYLPDMREHTVVFPFHDEALRPGGPPLAFGVEGPPQFTAEFPVARDNPDVMRLLNRADFILLWRDDLNRMERYNLQGLSKRLLNVSKASEESRYEAYHNAILRHDLMASEARQALVAENQARLAALAPRLRSRKAYVFGTGPSLGLAMDMDFSDGVSIVCNAAVRNAPLLDRIKPACIVAADPALHYGVSRYAAAFREHLVAAMRRHGSYLFMPMGYYPLFVRQYPDLAPRVFGVPVVPARPENVSVDLTQRYQIACYANILTLFLLPLGATLAQEVHVLGCDGRSPLPEDEGGNPSPFWKHHGDSEFEEIYDTLKICHPSFFDLNYEDWYAEHCQGVSILTQKAEAAGRVVRVDTPSYIPCLARRLTPRHREACLAALEKAPAQDSAYARVRDTRTKSRYTVSVIVSMYKAERFVAPMLHNLLSQTLYRRGEVEVLLIDSASPANDGGEAAPFLGAHAHLFYGRTRERETVYGAFNRAIRESRGRYIMNLDTDNRLRLDALEIFAGQLDGRPDIGLVYGNQYIGQFENETFYNHVKFGRCRRPRFSRDMMLHKYYFGSELMWRRELHDKVGYYDESYVVAGDYEMVCRLATVTDFLHVDRYFGLYLKNLGGVEYSNLALCDAEDQRIREAYAQAFPKAVDPPRVHVHYPIAPKAPNDYMTIVCHTMSCDKPIDRSVMKLHESLEFPFILYSVDQNSSQATRDSIAYLEGEGLLVAGDALPPTVRALFEGRIAYRPAVRFLLLAHGETVLLDKDFLSMKRPALTNYFKKAHLDLTAPFRTAEGLFDPLKVPVYCDYHEFERLDLGPHTAVDARGVADGAADGDLTVCIQHYAPTGQEGTYREALKRAVDSVRRQDWDGTVRVVVTDDGSAWSAQLAGDDPARRIRAHDRASLAGREAFRDIDADLYLYKPRTGYFSKGVLWNAAVALTGSPRLVFLDDDHHFLRPDSLRRYAELLDRYELVVGDTREYRFRDCDGVRHSMRLGYESPVVQGSNFGLRRELLQAVGGFDKRTFLWGTGDDPALFWKLFQHLRPASPEAPLRACYAEAIVTENPYSGRWREDCRVELELFLRDFLRLYGVHPNSNPSRDRTTWMERIPDPRAEAPAAAPVREAASGEAVLTVVVAAQGAAFRDVWTTVAALLEQRLPEPLRVVVAAGPELTPEDEALLPRAAEVRRPEAATPGAGVLRCLRDVATPYAGWIMSGDLPGEKLLKGALTRLRETGADLVYGASARFGRRGFGLDHAAAPSLAVDTAMAMAGLWQPGQPVFGKGAALRELAATATEDANWDLELLFRAAAAGLAVSATDRVFSLHEAGALPRLAADQAARLVAGHFGDRLAEALAGGVASLRVRDGEERRLEESRRLVPWCRELRARLDWIRRTIEGAGRGVAGKAAIFGADKDGELLLTLFWPRSLEAVCFVDEGASGSGFAGLPVLSPAGLDSAGLAAVAPSSPRHEERFLLLSKELAWPQRRVPAA
ncbi:glycosyltransferase [Solidesulfovibrio sp.]|uniref:glycosyltransferase n=1 Tax=Solidesulfovibrio sp. TaxID=2910990 RepID=UPI0026371C11|nr:glycosyltransferase [Solidesulfovibrio sp.]